MAGTKTQKGNKKKFNAIHFFNEYNTILIFVLMLIISSFVSSSFFSVGNLTNLLKQNAGMGIVSLGMLMVIMTGGIDLSVGAILTLGNIVFAYTLAKGMGLPIAVLAAVGVGLLCGLVSGYIVAYQKVAAFVVTLAIMQIAKGFAYIISGGASIRIQSDSYLTFSKSYIAGLPTQFYIMIIIFIVIFLIFKFTSYGRLVLATGSNEEAVRLSGIKTNMYRMSVYAISGVFSAIAGIIVCGRTGVGSPLVGDGTEMDAIASCVIAGASLNGGNGSVVKTLFGVFTLGLISNIMNLLKVPAYPQLVIKGIIILVAVLLPQLTKHEQSNT